MRNTLCCILAVLCTFGARAQITVTAATFPAAGDTLHYAQSNNPALPNMITPPGGNQTWDFSGLTSNEIFQTVYQPAAQGQYAAEFPGADVGVFTANSERYYNVTTTKFELLGYTSDKLFNYNFTVLYKNNPPFAERHAPLNFFDIYQQSQGQLVGFAVAELPVALMDALESFIPNPDSIRLRIAQQVLDVVDGWGTLTVPGPLPRPQYAVLRQKRTEYVERRLDAKISPLGWLDVTDLAISNNLDGGTGYFGVDTTVTHYFLSNEAKEEIAVATLNNDQSAVQSVRYKNNGITSPVGDKPTPNDPAIRAYPNPASGRVCFECTNLPAGEYLLRLFDSAGRVVWSNTCLLAGTHSICTELKHLEKGVYFYRLEDPKGRLVGANRLVVGWD